MSGSVARITSATGSRRRRATSSAILSSPGPMPSMGEIAPCNTWYTPWYSPVSSMASTSSGSSTTHRIDRSRRGDRQMAQRSPSAMKKHCSQKRMRALSSTRAPASRSTEARGARTGEKERRWAVLGPMPGSRPSSSISRVSAPGTSVIGLPQHARRQTEPAQPAGQRPQLPGRQVARLLQGVVHRRQDQVLQHVHIARVDDFGFDRDRQYLLVAVGYHRHHAAASRAGHRLLPQLLLDLAHASLHLLQLLEHLELLPHAQRPRGTTFTDTASNRFIASRTSGSSAAEARLGAADAGGGGVAAWPSPAANSTRTSLPNTSRTAAVSMSFLSGFCISSRWLG